MSLVFVHGVNTRADAAYRNNQKLRDGLFREFVLDDPGAKVVIRNPYWGQYAAKFAWNHACLPDDKPEAFGSDKAVFEQILSELASDVAAPTNQLLLTLAQRSLLTAVDCLWSASAFTNLGQDDEGMVVLARKAAAYAEANPKPGWLADIANDNQFIDLLCYEVKKWVPATLSPGCGGTIESFGGTSILGRIKTAAANLANAAAGAVLNPVTKVMRPWLHDRVALFLGDVFVYLDQRGAVGSEGQIVKEVIAAFQQAAAAKQTAPSEPLIIVAHSMGGNISYDILSHFRPDLECDLFVTVGSQVGLFEELKLFRASDRLLPSAAIKQVLKPKNIKRWINVYDPADILGYSTARIFAGSEDYSFSTGTSPLSAHGMYFYRPSFHQRLRQRMM